MAWCLGIFSVHMTSDSSAWKGVASVAGLGGGTVGWGATTEVGRCAVSFERWDGGGGDGLRHTPGGARANHLGGGSFIL